MKSKKICVVTATRAEYGLLKNIILKLKEIPEYTVNVVVTGMHLSPEFGFTYREIEADGIVIDKKIDILLSADAASAVSKTMGLAMIQFADYFETSKPDLLIVLGDRYETLAVCCAAMNQRIPIAHLHGGETTQGAVDEAIRHAITKLSFLHFTSTESYRNRVIQLGEAPERVFCVGAMGIENIINTPLLTREELKESLAREQPGFELDGDYAVVTFHPVTLENGSERKQVEELLAAIHRTKDCKFVMTKANADAGGRVINAILDDFLVKEEKEQPGKVFLTESLGMVRYLSALKYSVMVVGNSSSGLMEAPFFGIPTVNIGNRQKGRIQGESIINCEPVCTDILHAMKTARTKEWQERCRNAKNPYGDGHTSDKITAVIQEWLETDRIQLMKEFYDIEFL
ncbi:MAG: UDP-N-acetylglucosamine 2-epimerase [Bacteroidales bacterium]|nr:UDP-N-acetylglucosamine 2-epimerase [Lachnoclostridium sp.]MCM1383950.1 UDP-N-acetylglucosamine 2-epimerase [Lachnoclostridium sp.]MCM1464659.1 UDP-N-acetylglucosamine 2-epimerase [Bacteroidales bacterium]